MWNGFSMISKRPELTEGMMETLVEAERMLLESPGNISYPTPSTRMYCIPLTLNTTSDKNKYFYGVCSLLYRK